MSTTKQVIVTLETLSSYLANILLPLALKKIKVFVNNDFFKKKTSKVLKGKQILRNQNISKLLEMG